VAVRCSSSRTSSDGPAASVNVRHYPVTVQTMELATWAEETARTHLAEHLPRRWAHSQGVAARARTLAPLLGDDADLLEAAAWLHDVGYAPHLASAGFHPLDGARFLRDTEPVPAAMSARQAICRLVAYHSCAMNEAAERGIAQIVAAEFPPPRRDLLAALTYCDVTTSPDGIPVLFEQRLAEILSRYGPDHLVTRSVTRSAPQLRADVAAITGRLAAATADVLALAAT